MPDLYSIGHSTHAAEAFTGLLRQHGVTAVCDVRSMPFSRWNPQFNRERLKSALAASGIEYVFLGKELGARSENPACYADGRAQYDRLAREPAFAEGLERVRTGMQRFRVALLCAERDPLNCHRTILVWHALRAPGLSINHILADGSIESGEAADRRLMALMRIKPDLMHSEAEAIEAAYAAQGRKIAYKLRPPGGARE